VFNIGPMEFVILALVGVVVIGPDRLPQFARDAARMIRTLRDMATGARQQLREELGPEFADIDLRNLNPRTAVQRAVFGDELPDLRKYSPSNIMRDVVYGEQEADEPGGDVPASDVAAGDDGLGVGGPVSMTKPTPAPPSANGHRPRPRPRPRTSYDEDAT
jgi:sec-independent protein translocase protein TatB